MTASRHSTAKVQSALVVLMSLPGAAVYTAMTIQIIALVGLNTVAIAASARAMRRLVLLQSTESHTDLESLTS